MIGHDDFDQTLAGWFEADALPPAPAGDLERTLAAVGHRRPRPAWLSSLGSHWVGEATDTYASSGVRTLPRSGVRWQTALILLLVILALVGGAILVGAGLAKPAPLPNGPLGQLTYGLNGDIYTAGWDGTNPVRIADGASDPCGGFGGGGSMWSPDGRHLAYRSSGNCPEAVHLIDAAGRNVVSFPGTGWLVAWSPDSTRVATWLVQAQTVAIYGLDGARQQMLALPAGYGPPGDFDPIWSPDGQSLLIRLAQRTQSNTLVGRDGVWQLPVDGSAPSPVPPGDPRSDLAAFSNDRSRAAFTSTVATVAGGPGVDFFALVVAGRDGTPIRTLIGGQNGSNGPIDGETFREPMWSASGQQLAFVASTGAYYDQQGNPGSRTYDLRVLDLTSQITTTLAIASGTELSLDPIRFSPAGDRILFSETDSSGGASLWSARTDGSGTKLIVPGTSWGDWQPVP
jgi:Tol biopolymer transport system component